MTNDKFVAWNCFKTFTQLFLNVTIIDLLKSLQAEACGFYASVNTPKAFIFNHHKNNWQKRPSVSVLPTGFWPEISFVSTCENCCIRLFRLKFSFWNTKIIFYTKISPRWNLLSTNHFYQINPNKVILTLSWSYRSPISWFY